MRAGWNTNMQRLLVQALAMRQLGRLSSHHLQAGYGQRRSEWCPRTIHTRQLWGCSATPTAGCHRPALCCRDVARGLTVHQLRFKSNKRKNTAVQEDEKDPEDSEYEDGTDEEDADVPKDYKDIEKFVQSFRYDVVLRAGLDMARNKIEDSFYSNKLRLNGQKLIKKSKTVKVGDTLDLVLAEDPEANTVTLMRVVLRKVLGESSSTDKHKVSLRRWKRVELSVDQAFKP